MSPLVFVFPAVAANILATLPAGLLPAGTPWLLVVNTVVACAAVAFAVGVVAYVAWRRSYENRADKRWRSRFTTAQARANRYEALFASEPLLGLVWTLNGKVGQDSAISAWPTPEVLGQGGALADLVGRRHLRRPDQVYAALLESFKEEDAAELETALRALANEGQPFTRRFEFTNGGGVLAEGRAVGADIAFWLAEITAERLEIRRLEKALAASEEERAKLQTFLDHLPVPAWRRNERLHLEWANSAYAEAVEADRADTAVEQSIEIDRAEPELVRKAITDGEPAREQKYVVIRGQRRLLDITELPLEGGSAGFALDATAEDNATIDLRRHIEAHADTLNRLKTAVAIFGSDQRLKFFNQAYAQLWPLDEAWLDTGPSKGEILDRLRDLRRVPEQADFQSWKNERLARFTEVNEQPDEVWHLPDGRTLRIAAQHHPFGGLLYLYEDLSNMVALESSFNRLIETQRATLDNLYEGVALFGSDGRLKLYNQSFVRIWHLGARNLEGEPHFDQIASWCSVLFGELNDWQLIQQTVTEISKERRTQEGNQARADGSVVQYAAIPLPDGATLLSFIDISDTFRIERALRERNEALETADRLKSEFVGHVSYHLRTPLNTITGFGELLEQEMFGALNEKQHEYSSGILEASNQLMALINDILDLATIEAGAMALEIDTVDVFQVLQSAVNLTAKRALDAGLVLKLECNESIGTIRADERRIKQIVFNLLSNAISFTQEGGQVTVGAKRAGPQVCVWVEDTGSGIAPKRMANVFERFESHGGEGRRGAGLGLSLVKSFVELHGGWVSMESDEGAGTKVACFLPEQAVLNRDAAE